MFRILILLIAIAFVGCKTTQKIFAPSKNLQLFTSTLEGEYNSKEQSISDTDYMNISLVMKRIWTDRKDAYWIYVEQALASKMEKPYRQRVYRVTEEDSIVISRIYQFDDPLQYAGAQNDTAKMNKLTFNKLTTKAGCDVLMLNTGNNKWEGSTIGNKCPSVLRGSKYATSKIKLFYNKLESWDQGFDSLDHQVWGATKGAYIFKKTKYSPEQMKRNMAPNNNFHQ
jgi:hypothetical protein